MACPLLVPLVEEGWTGPLVGNLPEAYAAQAASVPPQVVAPPQVAVTSEVIRIYLAELNAEAAAQGMNPDTLLLGCTHYPLLRPLLERAIPIGMKIIDSADATAEAAVRYFGQQKMEKRPPSAQDPAAKDPNAQVQVRCFATDSVEKFERLGSRFLNRPTGKVELVDLGG
jgi:glutamate racemase